MKWKLLSKQEATIRAHLFQGMLLRANPLASMGEAKLITALLSQALEDALGSRSWEGRTARRWFDSGEAFLWTKLMDLQDEEYIKLLLKEAIHTKLPKGVGVIYRNIRRN